MAPTHMEVPSGSFIRLLYEASAEGIVPVLAVKLQEMFGMQESPAIAEGKVPVLVHLLSPAGRPCRSPAISKDLEEWVSSRQSGNAGAVSEAPWPEDPLRPSPHG